MGKSKGSKPGKGKDSLAKARPSALKKPTAKDDRATNTKAKSSKKVSFRDEKAEGKKEASKAKAAEIVEEVLKRAREANANKRDKVAKETKKDTKKEKEKQAETATAASKKTGDEKGKKKGIEKHVEEKEKKRDEKKMCDEKDKAAKTSSAAGTVTPPVKRHRMKSPPLSEASAESCKHLLELEQAAREATARAEMDAGGIDGFLDELRDLVASGGDLGDFLESCKKSAAAAVSAEAELKAAEGKTKAKEVAPELRAKEVKGGAHKRKKTPAEERREDKESKAESEEEEEEEDEADEASGSENMEEEEEEDNSQDEEEEDEEEEGEPEENGSEEEDEEEDGDKEDDEGSADEEDDKEDDEEEEEQPTEGPDKKDEKNKTGLEAAVSKTKENTEKLRNSQSNKREWDKFDRQCRNRNVFPSSLAPYLVKKKVELFNWWLDADQVWDKVVMIAERGQESKNLSRKQWTAVQVKELRKQFSAEKVEDLLQKRYSAGLWYKDDDYPDDLEERCFFGSVLNCQTNNTPSNMLRRLMTLLPF